MSIYTNAWGGEMLAVPSQRVNAAIALRNEPLHLRIKELEKALAEAYDVVNAQTAKITHLSALVEHHGILEGAKVSASSVIAEISELHQIPVALIKGPRRATKLVTARHHAIYEVARRCPWLSLPEIGRAFGDRDHSSIINALRKWPARAATAGIVCAPLTEVNAGRWLERVMT